MKVVLATAFPRDVTRPHGGVEAVSVVLAGALAREPGLEVHVVTTRSGAESIEVATADGLTIHHLPWSSTRMITGAAGREGRRLRDYITSLGCDVVHAHDTYGIMLRGLALPRVLTIHGFIHEDTRVSGERWASLRARVWRAVETAAWRDYRHIVSISPYVRERLRGIATGVIHDIDNPIAEPFFGVARRDAGRDIFCAATISPRKNTLGLVEAFARLRAGGIDARLILAGSQATPYGARVQARIAALGLTPSVTILPSIPTSEVRQRLATASVAALVSLEENAPLMIEEAMAAGVPVVTSNRCGMPYLVADGDTGYLVDPHDPDDIAGRLAELLADESLRARMGERARAVASARFHPAIVARRTREVYARALAGRARGQSRGLAPAGAAATGR